MFKSILLALVRGPLLRLFEDLLADVRDKLVAQVDGDGAELTSVEAGMTPEERLIAVRAIDAAVSRIREAFYKAIGADAPSPPA